jgi:hypothetical protein
MHDNRAHPGERVALQLEKMTFERSPTLFDHQFSVGQNAHNRMILLSLNIDLPEPTI